MARVYLTALKQVSDVIYSVDSSVGASGTNRKEDVLLVQLLLRGLTTAGGGQAAYLPPGLPIIKVDGFSGPQTIAYIKHFATENSKRNNNAPRAKSGRVDPIAPGQSIDPASGGIYLILALNITYAQMRGRDRHNDIQKDPQFPAGLKSHIYI
jgi:hypothetical protein